MVYIYVRGEKSGREANGARVRGGCAYLSRLISGPSAKSIYTSMCIVLQAYVRLIIMISLWRASIQARGRFNTRLSSSLMPFENPTSHTRLYLLMCVCVSTYIVDSFLSLYTRSRTHITKLMTQRSEAPFIAPPRLYNCLFTDKMHACYILLIKDLICRDDEKYRLITPLICI